MCYRGDCCSERPCRKLRLHVDQHSPWTLRGFRECDHDIDIEPIEGAVAKTLPELMTMIDNQASKVGRIARDAMGRAAYMASWTNFGYPYETDALAIFRILVEYFPEPQASSSGDGNKKEKIKTRDAGDAGSEPIRGRMCCYLPPKYVPLFLNGPLTPIETWTRLRGSIVADGKEAD